MAAPRSRAKGYRISEVLSTGAIDAGAAKALLKPATATILRCAKEHLDGIEQARLFLMVKKGGAISAVTARPSSPSGKALATCAKPSLMKIRFEGFGGALATVELSLSP